jgi:hypothetical protein
MPGRIFIESRPAAIGQRHLYLVFLNQSGQESVIRGGAEHEDAQGMFAGFFAGHGPIIIEAGNSMGGSRDYRDPNNFPSDRSRLEITDKFQDRDPEAVWRSWESMSRRIGDSSVEYHLGGPNSNTTIASVLASEGININDVRPGSFESYPGIESDNIGLLSPYKLPLDIMPGTSPVYDSNVSLPWLSDSYTPPSSVGTSSFREGEWNAVDVGTGPSSPMDSNIGQMIQSISSGRSRDGKSSARRILLMSATTLAQSIIKSRQKSLERDLMDIFSFREELPKQGGRTPPYISDGSGSSGFGNMLFNTVGNMIGAALSRNHTRISSSESDRSRDARQSWNSSQSQQAAMLAQIVQQGTRNL